MIELVASVAFWSVVSLWFWAVLMPGPDFFFVVRSAVSQGPKYGFASVAGIVAGTLVWLIVGFVFVHWLSKTSFFDVMKIVGGGYLFLMAYKIFISLKAQISQEEQNIEVKETRWKSFVFGILTNLANPKPPIFISAILSKMPSNLEVEQSLFLLCVMLLIPALWFSCVVKVLSAPRFFGLFMRYAKVIDGVVVVILVCFGLNLIIEGIQAFWD